MQYTCCIELEMNKMYTLETDDKIIHYYHDNVSQFLILYYGRKNKFEVHVSFDLKESELHLPIYGEISSIDFDVMKCTPEDLATIFNDICYWRDHYNTYCQDVVPTFEEYWKCKTTNE